jgi:hypothetical protein
MGLFEALALHFLLVIAALTGIAVILRRRGRFHWVSAGFWAWSSMCLYFVAAPLLQWHLGGSELYLKPLSYTEGLPRLITITGCLVLGSGAFFASYLRTRPGQVHFHLPPSGWPRGTWLVVLLSLLGAGYSLIAYRGFFGYTAGSEPLLIEGGKFVGQVIGYAYVMHTFALFPIIFLINRRKTRLLGLFLAMVYVMGRLEDPWDRATIVGLGLSLSMLAVIAGQRFWPRLPFLAGLALLALMLQMRGHVSLSAFWESGSLTPAFAKESLAFGPDAAMLPTLWLESYLYDRAGYTYGLDSLARLAVGPLPRKFFPWKDQVVEALFLPDPLQMAAIPGYELLYGAKSTIVGSFYAYGGIIGVLLGMALLGMLTRKLDGMVSSLSNPAVRVLGLVWLGMYWMVFGSNFEWGAAFLYLSGLPFLLLVLAARITGTTPTPQRVQSPSALMTPYARAPKNCHPVP